MNEQGTKPVDRRLWWLAGAMVFMAVALGCTPSTLSMLLVPFSDDKLPAKCKLKKDKGESTVVVYAQFARGDVPLDLEPSASELADVFAMHLKQRCAANKEKIVIVPPSKVRSYLNNRFGEAVNDKELGEHFKADYVIRFEIQSLSLYVRGSAKGLFQGEANVEVAVTDAKAPEGEGRIFSEVYRRSYPKSGPKDAQGASSLQFRTMFVNRMGKDLSSWFTAFPSDETKEMD
ncbi:MAG: hypothetical protein U0793_13080 [Gemmataceae bacterium]